MSGMKKSNPGQGVRGFVVMRRYGQVMARVSVGLLAIVAGVELG